MRAYFFLEKEDTHMAELSRPIDREFNVEVEGGRLIQFS